MIQSRHRQMCRLLLRTLLLEAGPIAVSPHVHPVPRPALAVLRTGEQSIDDVLVRLRATRRPGTPPALPASAAGRPDRNTRVATDVALSADLDRHEPTRFVLRGEKRIDRIRRPRLIPARAARRDAAAAGTPNGRAGRPASAHRGPVRPDRSTVVRVRSCSVGERCPFLLGRHPHARFAREHRNQQAVLRIAGLDGDRCRRLELIRRQYPVAGLPADAAHCGTDNNGRQGSV